MSAVNDSILDKIVEKQEQITNLAYENRKMGDFLAKLGLTIDESNIILRMDLNKNITYANEAFYNISGFTKDELIGKNYFIFEYINLLKQKKSKADEMFDEKIWKGENSYLNKNKQIFRSGNMFWHNEFFSWSRARVWQGLNDNWLAHCQVIIKK